MKRLLAILLIALASVSFFPRTTYAVAPTVVQVVTSGPTNRDSGERTTITKPTALAEGDLMVAVIQKASSGGGVANANPFDTSDWTSLANNDVDISFSSSRQQVYYKIADADDVADTDFAWTTGESGGISAFGAIYHITGYSGTPVTATGETGASWTTTQTPNYADSLFLFLFGAGGNAGSGSVSNYAFATDNPTWTEAYDAFHANVSDGDSLNAGAYASRTAVTATGNSSATITTFPNSQSITTIVMIDPVPPSTIQRPPVIWWYF